MSAAPDQHPSGKQTPIASIGEFGLIDRLKQLVDNGTGDPPLRERLIQGISDDTAVFRPTPGMVQLVTTEAFAEGVHFDLTYTSMKHLGWKVMGASLSDIAAMGGHPRYATVTLSIPKKISVEMLEELYQGIAAAGREYHCLVVGGDTITSMGNFEISVTIIGEGEESKLVYRKGAMPGDYLCVTGHLGASVAGLKIFQREKERYARSERPEAFVPNLEPYARALEKHLMPRPRFDLSELLTSKVRVHAMIDISDGLASEVHHICQAGNVGAAIYEHNLPLVALTQQIAHEFSESPTSYALYGGDEYELLFAIPEDAYNVLEGLTDDVTIVGRCTEADQGIVFVREDGQREPLRAGGWDHFTAPA